jgi:hypothetical protein
MPALTRPLFEHEEPFGMNAASTGETTHAEGEEDPATTSATGEEDATYGRLVEDPFGSF